MAGIHGHFHELEYIISTKARTILLPRLCLTEVVQHDTPSASEIALPADSPSASYFVRPCVDNETGNRADERPKWMGTQFNLFPVVVDSKGVPWAEATVYILSRLEETFNPSMGTYSAIADDLAAFLRFLEEEPKLDWMVFPKKKFERPTYRYRAALWLKVSAEELAATTAKRRMSTVISFYAWLQKQKVLSLEHPPWVESDRYIQITDSRGQTGYKKVSTTDLTIPVAKQVDPYSDHIEDGGKLRPLSETEQRWLLDALIEHDNIELTLIHLLALLTGARIQSVLTIRVRHVTSPQLVSPNTDEVRLPIGPGTGIDTKNNKRMVLHIPTWLYDMLGQYAESPRAGNRRARAKGGQSVDQYLFLSVRGAPLYESKDAAANYDDTNRLRHTKDGQAVRQLISDYIIPFIQRKHNPNFRYRFHDLRATFGMNLTDEQLKRVSAGEITLHQAREFVKDRMGHESAATTDLYLQHRGKLKFSRGTNNEYGEHLKALATAAFKGKQ